MNRHYPLHSSVLTNFYGCDPYNTVDAQPLRRRVRRIDGPELYAPRFKHTNLYKGAIHQPCLLTWPQARCMK